MYGAWGLSQPHCWGQSPHSAAAAISHAAITTPIPVFIAAATTRPISAPVATRVDVPTVASRREYSATNAPANDPTNAPITEPMIGTGTPTIAPTMPPMIAPHPARRERELEHLGDRRQDHRRADREPADRIARHERVVPDRRADHDPRSRKTQ